PQSSNSHSVAADSKRNLIFVPQVAPVLVVGVGGDTTAVGAGICGSNNGCVGVYQHQVNGQGQDDNNQGNQNNQASQGDSGKSDPGAQIAPPPVAPPVGRRGL